MNDEELKEKLLTTMHFDHFIEDFITNLCLMIGLDEDGFQDVYNEVMNHGEQLEDSFYRNYLKLFESKETLNRACQLIPIAEEAQGLFLDDFEEIMTRIIERYTGQNTEEETLH